MASSTKNLKKMLWILKWTGRKLLNGIEIFGVLIFLLFEEILWNLVGAPIYRYFRNFRLLKKLQAYIEGDINEWLLLIIFSVPFVVMEAMAILAGRMFVTGNFFLGILFYILKGLSTIPVVTLFSMGKEKLLNFKIILWSYHLILWLQNTTIYLRVKQRIQWIKSYMAPKITVIKNFFLKKRFGLSHRLKRYYSFLRKKVR